MPQFVPRYNIAPTQLVLVIRCGEDGQNRIDLLKWGLIPSWAKDPKIGSSMINARSETVHEKPAFRHLIKFKRCIVPASGYCDWLHIGDKKQPYYFHMTDGSPMCFAGVYDSWKTPNGTQLETFSILTTTANTLVEPIHDRMPVILHPQDYILWLNRNMHDPEELRGLYQPFPPDLLTAYKVPDLVNNPRFDAPACIVQV